MTFGPYYVMSHQSIARFHEQIAQFSMSYQSRLITFNLNKFVSDIFSITPTYMCATQTTYKMVETTQSFLECVLYGKKHRYLENYSTHTGQVPACSQEPVDSTDANIVETSTCLETTQQETTNLTVRLLIESDWSMFSCAPEC